MRPGGLGGCDASGVHPVRLALSRAGAVGGGSTLLQHGAVKCKQGHHADRIAGAAADVPS